MAIPIHTHMPDKRYVPSGADYEDAYRRFAALDEKMNQVKGI